jgi:hypothetical protein
VTTRDEHLEWAKQRALEYLDMSDPQQAFTSMLSDLSKHPETKNHLGGQIGVMFMMLPGWISNAQRVREWIVGFN